MKRLNADERGQYLGEFDGDDKILVVLSDGSYELSNFDLSNHFDEKMIRIEKFYPEHVYTVVHQDGKSGTYFVKRFKFDDQPIGKRISFINEEPGSKLVLMSNAAEPTVKLDILKGKSQTEETLEQPLTEIIDIKGIKAQGNRLSFHTVKSVTLITADEDLSEKGKEKAEVASEGGETKSGETKSSAATDEISADATKDKKEDDIKLEITNPDDIQIDDKGQMEMF
ncbi:DNA topoisomerase IV subunit A [compost metagenome]